MRGGRATLIPCADDSMRLAPLLHHVQPDGSAALLLPDDHRLVATAWQLPRGDLTAVLELADPAPVTLREPVRGLLWIAETAARAEALAIAEERADPRLLDTGHGLAVLRLVPASLVLADAEGTSSVQIAQFASARPDPFCRQEDGWLRHLELSHRDVVGLLTRHLPEQLRGGHVRPLGLDRFGLRLRVEAADADHDVRIAFSRPVSTPGELAAELRQLVGCPFLAATGRSGG